MTPADLCQAFNLTGWWLLLCLAIIAGLMAVVGYRVGITAQKTLPDQKPPADDRRGGI